MTSQVAQDGTATYGTDRAITSCHTHESSKVREALNSAHNHIMIQQPLLKTYKLQAQTSLTTPRFQPEAAGLEAQTLPLSCAAFVQPMALMKNQLVEAAAVEN